VVLGLWEMVSGAGAWVQYGRTPPARGGAGAGVGAGGGGQAASLFPSSRSLALLVSK